VRTEGDRKFNHQQLKIVIVSDEKLFHLFYCWRSKDFGCHMNGDQKFSITIQMGCGRHLDFFDYWMVIKVFWLLVTEFGKGACNMFLESSHQLYTLRPNVIENSVVNA
jgi:hypothetical protein